jgi:hypothetical protein
MDNAPMNQQAINKKPTSPVLWVIFGIVVLAVAGGIWYVVAKGNDNANSVNVLINTVVGNLNVIANTNRVLGNVNTNINTDDWLSYSDAYVSFRYPTSWKATQIAVSGGSFEVSNSHSVVVEPLSNPLDFKPAGRCVIEVFPANGKSLSNWVTSSSLYQDTGLIIISQTPIQIGSLTGVDVREGGENAQITRSYFFNKVGATHVVRFGYYLGVDATPQTTFEEISSTCNAVLETLTGK